MATIIALPLLDLTDRWVGWAALLVFVIAYALVMGEEALHLRKSKPVVLAAGIIWALVAVGYAQAGDTVTAAAAVRDDLTEFGELFLFLLAAMTYVNTMEERGVFDALRAWLVRHRLSLRAVFWATGILAFFLSAAIDNLTTALVVGTVVVTIGEGNPRFVTLACINVVVAANAGGAFSPFGDITTLLVWQAGAVPFWGFFALFIPALVNWLVPAVLMSFALPRGHPAPREAVATLRPGAGVVIGLFALTIATTVVFYNVLHLPPVLGMMTGLGVLNLYGFHLRRQGLRRAANPEDTGMPLSAIDVNPEANGGETFDIFRILAKAEWDTLMFFYGIILCVGGLAALGYLGGLSRWLYTDLGALPANVFIGVLSAVVDNIPVMFSVLAMHPGMSESEWLLVTLTAGVGGSLLSIGSAAGVALMGQARGVYTFAGHLRWSWAVALGYAASIGVHLLINGR